MSESMLNRLKGIFRSLGGVNGGLYLTDRMLRAASGERVRLYKYVLVAQPVGGISAQPMRPDAKTALTMIGPDHELVASFPRPCAVIKQRYASGAQCLAATVGGSFAGYMWWQFGGYEEDEVRCSYVLIEAETAVWDFDVYVEPRFRLGRTLARLWHQADTQLAAQGVRYSFSRISSFNAGSLASHARLGARARATALFLVIGQIQLSLFSTGPLMHLSLRPDSRPVLRLSSS